MRPSPIVAVDVVAEQVHHDPDLRRRRHLAADLRPARVDLRKTVSTLLDVARGNKCRMERDLHAAERVARSENYVPANAGRERATPPRR